MVTFLGSQWLSLRVERKKGNFSIVDQTRSYGGGLGVSNLMYDMTV